LQWSENDVGPAMILRPSKLSSQYLYAQLGAVEGFVPQHLRCSVAFSCGLPIPSLLLIIWLSLQRKHITHYVSCLSKLGCISSAKWSTFLPLQFSIFIIALKTQPWCLSSSMFIIATISSLYQFANVIHNLRHSYFICLIDTCFVGTLHSVHVHLVCLLHHTPTGVYKHTSVITMSTFASVNKTIHILFLLHLQCSIQPLSKIHSYHS